MDMNQNKHAREQIKSQLLKNERAKFLLMLRNVQHPLYEWLRVDIRSAQEIEESRKLESVYLHRLAKNAAKNGNASLRVEKDLDGAYRLHGRLDRGKGFKVKKIQTG